MSEQRDPLQDTRLLLAQGWLWEAERSCLSVLERQPTDINTLRLAAQIARRAAKGQLAVDLLIRAARIVPADAGIPAELAQLLIDQKRAPEAIAVLQQALGTGAVAADIHHLLGVAFRDMNRLEDAEAALRSALELDSRRAVTHDCLAHVLRTRGRLRETQHHLELLLQLQPDSLPTLVALGDVLTEQRQYAAAIPLFREAQAKLPDPAPIWARIGVALKEMGDSQGALDALAAAAAGAPNSPEAHYYLADAQLTFGRFTDAVQSARNAARLGVGVAAREIWGAALAGLGDTPGAVEVLRAGDSPARPRNEYLSVLGNRLARAGARDRARECFQLLIEDNPDDPVASHIAAALSGRSPDNPSPEYVRKVFDDYATHFDAHLVGELGYSGPHELKSALIAAGTRDGPWDLLDLGCGTGLLAVEFAGLSARIDGVDLSPKMIERARDRKLYTTLTCGDLLSVLQRCAADCYDLVTAADVFIYVGKIDAVIAAARRVLRPHGMLAFTAEAAEYSSTSRQPEAPPGYWLDITGRYSHSASYLAALAAQNGFKVEVQQLVWLRREFDRHVAAWLAVWSVGSAGQAQT